VPYLNLDDNYPDHPKVEALSDAAYRLHGASMFYAARFQLDGYLTTPNSKHAGTGRQDRARTLGERLLHAPGDECESKKCPPDDGRRYRLHDFFQWNKPKSWWDGTREGRQAEGQMEGRPSGEGTGDRT
jgi:hypothetical protein